MWKKWADCRCAEGWGDAGLLILRVAIGLIFLVHGWNKLTGMGIEGVTGMLSSLGFPLAGFFAIVLLTVEIVGGTALILGLFTHWAAKLTAIVALVALVLVHLGKGFAVEGGGYEFVLLLLASTVAVMTMGGGKYSLDHQMWRK